MTPSGPKVVVVVVVVDDGELAPRPPAHPLRHVYHYSLPETSEGNGITSFFFSFPFPRAACFMPGLGTYVPNYTSRTPPLSLFVWFVFFFSSSSFFGPTPPTKALRARARPRQPGEKKKARGPIVGKNKKNKRATNGRHAPGEYIPGNRKENITYIHTIPYHTIPYHTIPYHTIPYHTSHFSLESHHAIYPERS